MFNLLLSNKLFKTPINVYFLLCNKKLKISQLNFPVLPERIKQNDFWLMYQKTFDKLIDF